MAKNQIDFSPTNPENAAMGAQAQTEAETEDTSLEVNVGPEEEKKAEVVTLTPEEFAALKAQADATKAMKEGIEGLSSKLIQPAAVAQQPANSPRQTAAEYYAEHSDADCLCVGCIDLVACD